MKIYREGIFIVGMALIACQTTDRATEPGNDPQSEVISIQDNSNDWVVKNESGEIIGGALAKSAYNVYDMKWNKSHLTYRLKGNWTSRDKAITADAFNAIGSVIPMTFQLVDATATSDIEISHVMGRDISGNYGAISMSAGGTGGPLYLYSCRIDIATIDHPIDGKSNVAARYNLFMNTMMHEIGHCMGMQHSQFTNTLMYPYVSWGQSPTTLESYPELYFLSPDDIQGLQSIYGPVPPKFPTWDHRYNLGYLHYVNHVPAPGAQPIGWTFSGGVFDKWSKLKETNLALQLNRETIRLAVRK